MPVIALLALGCSSPPVRLVGTVYQSAQSLSPALPQADVAFVDADGAQLAHTVTDEDGDFAVDLPAGATVFAEITAEGYALATFPGVTGLGTEARVEDRAIHGVSQAEVAATRARFAGCPGAGDDRPFVVGEIRIFGVTDPITGGNPSVATGTGDLWTKAGKRFEACYLDADGLAYDPEAFETGASGTFAIFGVPAGLHELEVTAEFGPGAYAGTPYPVWIPATSRIPGDGSKVVVSPWFPAYVQF